MRRRRRTEYPRVATAPPHAEPPHGETRHQARIHRRAREGADVPDEARHESADLDDYSIQEPADSLTGEPGEPGDDPLDRGIAPPERWSSVIRSGSDAGEQESLDQLLAEEEPDTSLLDADDELPEDRDDDDEADEYLDGLLLDDGPDPRAGRLVAEDEGAHPDEEEDLVDSDVGIDSGAA